MPTITNPTPEQTVNARLVAAAVERFTDDQIRAIGLLLQALDTESDVWGYYTGNLDDVGRLDEYHPALLAWPADAPIGDTRTLGVEIDEDGDCRFFDGDGPSMGRWRRVDGSDITGLLSAAWRAEFGA